MSSRSLRIICAWCRQVVSPGEIDADPTHTICDNCYTHLMTYRTGDAEPVTRHAASIARDFWEGFGKRN